MYLIFAATVLLSFWGLLSFVLVLLWVWPSWLLCLVRSGSWGSLVIRHEIRMNSNLPGLLSGFVSSSGELCPAGSVRPSWGAFWLLVPVVILCPVCCFRPVVSGS